MDFGALWKSREGDGYNGKLSLDADLILRAGVSYDLFLNPVGNKDNPKAPEFRLTLRHFTK